MDSGKDARAGGFLPERLIPAMRPLIGKMIFSIRAHSCHSWTVFSFVVSVSFVVGKNGDA